MRLSSNLLKSLTKLRPNKQKGITSPHKIALLLSVAQLFEEGVLVENRIEFSPELVATFQKVGQKLAPDYGNKLLIHMPIYHLQTSGLWHLKSDAGFERALTASHSPKSLTGLMEYVHYAYLSPELYAAMLDPIQREMVRKTLIDKYFPAARFRFQEVSKEVKPYLDLFETNFLSGIASEPDDDMGQEVRGTLFKQQVPKLYNYRCAISGMQVNSTKNASLVDACHIQPWSLNHVDTIQNGICLTPTLHRAFDRGLISISNEHRVLVSSAFVEDTGSSYALGQFRGMALLLPDKRDYAPSKEYLEWHRDIVFDVG